MVRNQLHFLAMSQGLCRKAKHTNEMQTRGKRRAVGGLSPRTCLNNRTADLLSALISNYMQAVKSRTEGEIEVQDASQSSWKWPSETASRAHLIPLIV
jgi:hypothetical protein